MKSRSRIWIVLPAYNEAEALPPLLEAIAEAMAESGLDYHVILVDDGSRDGTAEIARRHAALMPLTIERHETNLGLGATVRDGLMKATTLAAPRDVIVTMDADNSHTPNLILRMVRLVKEGSDVVVASRYQPGSRVIGVALSRRLLSYGGSFLMKLVFPIPGIRDYFCGFRAYRAGVLRKILEREGSSFFDQDGFQCMVDILLKLRVQPLIFGEVPLILRYDLKPGKSKMRIWETTYKTLLLLLRRRLGVRR